MIPPHLQAGVARRNITPPLGIPLIGYGGRWVPNRGAREPLTVTALALNDGTQTVMIISADLLAISEATYQRIQRAIPHLKIAPIVIQQA